MKNKVFAALTAIVLSLGLAFCASAADTHIFDQSGYITPDAFSTLEQQAQKIEDTYDCEVIVSVIGDSGQQSTIEYTKDLYKANVKGDNGIALTYNFGDQLYSYHCEGKTETLFPEQEQKNIFSNTFGNAQTYYDAVHTYLLAVEKVLSEAPEEKTEPAETEAEQTTIAEQTTEFVPTDRTLPLVVDNADILTDAEEADFTQKLETLGGKYELEAALLTVDTYEGKSDTEYADDYFIEKGYGLGENKDGFLIVYNTGKEDGTRNIYLCTHGSAIEYITDFERDVIFEMVIPYLEKGEYVQAFDTFISEADSATDPSTPVYYIPVSILIGFAIAFLIMKIQASKLKTVRPKVNAADYVGNVQLTYQSDNFMYMDVSKIKKSNNSSSSGGSSTHKSSSGDTFGGGGRNF